MHKLILLNTLIFILNFTFLPLTIAGDQSITQDQVIDESLKDSGQPLYDFKNSSGNKDFHLKRLKECVADIYHEETKDNLQECSDSFNASIFANAKIAEVKQAILAGMKSKIDEEARIERALSMDFADFMEEVRVENNLE